MFGEGGVAQGELSYEVIVQGGFVRGELSRGHRLGEIVLNSFLKYKSNVRRVNLFCTEHFQLTHDWRIYSGIAAKLVGETYPKLRIIYNKLFNEIYR